MTDAGSAVKSADRVFDLLELMAASDVPLSHSEIGVRLAIPKSSLTPLLRNMIARGYLEPARDGRNYRLGAAFFNLSRSSRRSLNIISEVKPLLTTATAELGESSAFHQLRGYEAEMMATAVGPHRLVTYMRPGDCAPLYATSYGKALLAHSSSSFRAEYFDAVVFERCTPATNTSKPKLIEELERIRETGFGYCLEEWTTGIVGIAMVVLDLGGLPVGAINHAIPVARFSEEMKRLARISIAQCVRELRARMFDA